MRLSSFITRGLDSPRGLFLLALGLALLWRLPFVPYAVVNWDESSFILVADSWVRGHLPYTEIAENKPPLIFGFLALLQLVCGKSIVAVRLAGVVLVAVTAWLCALTTRRSFGLRGWSAVALLPVVALGTFAPGSGALMAEHLAQVALAAILYLLTGERFERKRAFLLGLAAAAAVLTRTNLMYPALLLSGAMLVLPLAAGERRGHFLTAFAAGALLPLAALLFAYRHDLDTLYRFTVAGPLAYAEGGRLLTPAWFREVASFFALGWSPAVRPLAVGLVAGLVFGWMRRAATPVAGRMVVVLLVGWLGTMAGICAGGRVFDHYLMQVLPFSAPLLAVAVEALGRRWRILSVMALAFVLFWWGEPLARKYLHHVRRLEAGEPLWNDPAIKLARYLDQAGARGQTLYLTDAHIAYWLIDAKVPTRIGHPSNIGRPAMMRALAGPAWTACAEYESIFAQKPAFVVLSKNPSLPRVDRDGLDCLHRELATAYRLHGIVDYLHIYGRQDAM